MGCPRAARRCAAAAAGTMAALPAQCAYFSASQGYCRPTPSMTGRQADDWRRIAEGVLKVANAAARDRWACVRKQTATPAAAAAQARWCRLAGCPPPPPRAALPPLPAPLSPTLLRPLNTLQLPAAALGGWRAGRAGAACCSATRSGTQGGARSCSGPRAATRSNSSSRRSSCRPAASSARRGCSSAGSGGCLVSFCGSGAARSSSSLGRSGAAAAARHERRAGGSRAAGSDAV